MHFQHRIFSPCGRCIGISPYPLLGASGKHDPSKQDPLLWALPLYATLESVPGLSCPKLQIALHFHDFHICRFNQMWVEMFRGNGLNIYMVVNMHKFFPCHFLLNHTMQRLFIWCLYCIRYYKRFRNDLMYTEGCMQVICK